MNKSPARAIISVLLSLVLLFCTACSSSASGAEVFSSADVEESVGEMLLVSDFASAIAPDSYHWEFSPSTYETRLTMESESGKVVLSVLIPTEFSLGGAPSYETGSDSRDEDYMTDDEDEEDSEFVIYDEDEDYIISDADIYASEEVVKSGDTDTLDDNVLALDCVLLKAEWNQRGFERILPYIRGVGIGDKVSNVRRAYLDNGGKDEMYGVKALNPDADESWVSERRVGGYISDSKDGGTVLTYVYTDITDDEEWREYDVLKYFCTDRVERIVYEKISD